ncbi:MAG TPA: hypothetical protein VLD16_00240 [Gaiellaceae bacterium]|nr:hypothetical protein [Gaiellaceae bacterium]
MAAGQAGSAYEKVALLQQGPQELIHAFASLADDVRGCRLITVSPEVIVLERRFVPIWAYLVVPIGIAMVVLELSGAKAKQVENLTVTFSEEDGTTRVSAAGVANRALADALDGLLVEPTTPPSSSGVPHSS